MAINYAEVDKFNKVVIVYNRNSGKQLFASMIMKINEIYKRLKDALGSKTVELCEIKRFDDIRHGLLLIDSVPLFPGQYFSF